MVTFRFFIIVYDYNFDVDRVVFQFTFNNDMGNLDENIKTLLRLSIIMPVGYFFMANLGGQFMFFLMAQVGFF